MIIEQGRRRDFVRCVFRELCPHHGEIWWFKTVGDNPPVRADILEVTGVSVVYQLEGHPLTFNESLIRWAKLVCEGHVFKVFKI